MTPLPGTAPASLTEDQLKQYVADELERGRGRSLGLTTDVLDEGELLAQHSRLTSDARMPSWPMEMPSDTAMVTNSSGKPPAARTPSLARLASRSRGMLQGVTSFHELATPTWGLSQSSSVMPTARSMARAGARSNPSVTSRLRRSIGRW